YIYHLTQYGKVLKQRNNLLKQLQRGKQTDKTMLDVLTEQLVSHAADVLERRFMFLELLRKWAIPIHYGISRNLEDLEIQYQPTIDVLESTPREKIETAYLEKFNEIEEKERDRGTKLIGAHRDDLQFFVNGREVETVGSAG